MMNAQISSQRILSAVRLYDTLKFMGIDTAWFVRRIEESEFGSMRRLAPELTARSGRPMDIAALSRMLSGERDMVLSEARQLADLLDVPMGEVIKRAGTPFRSRDNI